MVERLREQMVEMEEWKAREQVLLRRVFKYLAIGLTFFMLAVGVAFWQIGGLVEKNRQLIDQVEDVAYTQALAGYEDCRTRNVRTRASVDGFKKLVTAHKADGNQEAAKIWAEYLVETQKQKLPTCEKPPAPDHPVVEGT